MSKRKTRLQTALDYASDVVKHANDPCLRASEWNLRWAFIAGAKWQQNRTLKRRTVGKNDAPK